MHGALPLPSPSHAASALLVDPTTRSRTMVLEQLQENGVSVKVCTHVEEAIAELDGYLYDLVITAIADRDVDTEFNELVRLRLPDVPIVQIVPMLPEGVDAEEGPEKVEPGGTVVVLNLPTSGNDLARAVATAIEHRDHRESLVNALDARFLRDRQDLALGDMLDRALENVYLVYQPVLRARSSCVVGYEALLRTTSRRFSKTSALLAVAERLGRKRDVDARVRQLLVEEFEQGAQWRTFFVNMDMDELAGDVLGLETDPLLPYASRVVIEVSQSTTGPMGPHLVANLSHLRDCGYRIAVGSIHSTTSSLVRMRALTPDIYKIGAGVIRRCDQSVARQRYILELVEIAHGEGALVVAQGIERPEELQAIIDLECDLAQGFLLGIPRARLD